MRVQDFLFIQHKQVSPLDVEGKFLPFKFQKNIDSTPDPCTIIVRYGMGFIFGSGITYGWIRSRFPVDLFKFKESTWVSP